MSDAVGRVVHYSGRVQGVGFRATVAALAGSYQVTGRVRNLQDGRVRLVVEGQSDEVGRFLAAVASRWAGHIHGTETEPREPTGEFHGFGIEP